MSQGVYDAIVVGLGGMGSAAAFELARRGRRVLGLEQFRPGHDRGSSHGRTRIIRQAYYEHPSYVPLVRRAYERWHDLEQRQGVHLLTSCPCLSLGRPDGELIAGVLASARQHQLPIEQLSCAEVKRRYPVFEPGADDVGVVELTAGFLAVEECVLAHVREAQRLGAEVHAEEAVVSWHAGADGVEVDTGSARYHAASLVLTAGPWASELLGRLGAALSLMRQVVFWFEPNSAIRFRRDAFPIFIAETADGAFYGLPMVDPAGVKIARHYGAPELRASGSNLEAVIDRAILDEDEAPVRRFAERYFPDAVGPRRRASVCIYTLTPDRHFVIDRHPEHANIVLAAGFSGHGFKFASIVGEVLADLVETGTTSLPIEMFRIGRFVS
jgi:sarcosine oxidase